MDGVPLRGESVTWGDNQEQWLERNGAAQEEPATQGFYIPGLQAAPHPPWRSGLFLQVCAGEGWAGNGGW